MSSVLDMLKRWDESVLESRRRRLQHVTLPVYEVVTLLRLFRGMDAQERKHYPPHVEMMIEAAKAALPHLQGTYAVDIMRALDYSTPGWRENANLENHVERTKGQEPIQSGNPRRGRYGGWDGHDPVGSIPPSGKPTRR